MREPLRSRIAVWNFILVFATTFYCTGGGMMESYVNYRSWRFVGPAEWHAFRASTEALLPVFVFPFFLSFVFKIAFLFLRPAGIPRWGPWVIAAAHLEAMVVTITFILPRFQGPLDDGPDPVLLDGLSFWDTVLRGIPGLATLPVLGYLAYRALRVSSSPPAG